MKDAEAFTKITEYLSKYVAVFFKYGGPDVSK